MFGISKKSVGRVILIVLSLVLNVLIMISMLGESHGQILKGAGVPSGFLGGALNAVFIPILFVIMYSVLYFMLYMFVVVFKTVMKSLTFFSLLGIAMGVLGAFVAWALIGLAITWVMKVHPVAPYIVSIAAIAFAVYGIITTVKGIICEVKLGKKMNDLVEE